MTFAFSYFFRYFFSSVSPAVDRIVTRLRMATWQFSVLPFLEILLFSYILFYVI